MTYHVKCRGVANTDKQWAENEQCDEILILTADSGEKLTDFFCFWF